MPLTAEERAARRESRRSNREKERRASNSARHNLQGYQSESARLFGLSVQSSNDSSNLVNSSNDSTNLVNSLNDSTNHLDSSYNSATKRRPIHRNLSGIEEGLDCSAAESKNSRNSMQPPGQDAAQGGSPRHNNRVGPFEKDTDDDDYYDDQEENTGGGSNNGGGVSTNPFLDDSTDGDGASSPEREFQPAKLDRSATSAKSSGRGGGANGEESFDTDDDPPSNNSRPATFAASALTTSSSATQRVNNTDGEGNNRKTARDKFMEVMQDDDDDDNREETTEDYGSAFNNDTGPSPFDDDSVDQASQGSYEQPRAYRPFSGGSQTSAGSGGGEHYASMQELLEEERSRSFVGHKTSRFGGCVETCLGGKKTKRRKITLAVIGLVIGAVIGVCVYSIVLGNGKDDGGGGKKEGVEKQLQQQIERPGTNFVPGNTGNASKPDSTFGMADNSTDDIFVEPTFPDGSTASGGDNATADSSSPTASPVSTSTIAPTPPVSEIIPGEFKATSPPSGSPTPPPLPEFEPLSETNQPTGSPAKTTVQPTGSPAAAETTFQPTVSPSAAKTTLQPTGSPSAAPFVSISTVMSDSPVTVEPVLSPTNPPIAASVPSVQTDIIGLLTFSEPVPQDTESNLIAFLDALKKSIRSAVSSSLQANDELVYVEIVSINGEAVDSLLLRRRFIRRRRLQFGSLVVYEIVVLTDCDLSDCTDADTVADDVFTRTTNEISSSVFSGEFASTLEVNVLSSSGGSVDYFTGVELGDFSEPKVTVLTPTVDLGANETSSTNSTAPADVIATNETDPIDSSATGDDTTTANTCEFCKDGMPDPFKVVSDSGLTCNQLIEAVSDKDKESSTCVTVKQAEGLCCEVSSTVSNTIDETPAMNTTIGGNETISTNSTEVDLGEPFMNATIGGNETISTNSTEGDLGDINATESPSLNSTLVGNETILTNITSGGDLSDVNETISSNFTPADFVIDTVVVGNETFVSFGDDMPIIDENGTDSGFVDDALYPDLLCPVTLTRSIKIDEFASLFYEVVPSSSFEARNGIFCARLQVKSLGWIGFALSRDGSMVGSEAIIALPDDGTVLKYSLLGKSPDLISKVDDEHQTLRGTSVTQDLALGVTTMAFVKHLDEFEEIPILEKGANHFLYARGGINVLGYHLGRMHFMKDFAEDVVVAVDDDVSVDLGDVNATILSNSTGPADADAGNGTTSSNFTELEDSVIDSNGTGSTDSTLAPSVETCKFCEDGMPDPFKVVSDSGLNCNQLKEAVADKDSDSNTCMAVKQGEGLCCELTSTIDETPTTPSTIASNETTSANSTSEDFNIVDTVDGNETGVSYDDVPINDTNATISPSMNSTLVGNETVTSTNSTSTDFIIIDSEVGNETNVTYDDTPLSDLNIPEPFYNTSLAGNETTMTTNSTPADFVIDTVVVGNETFVSFGDDMPIIDENGTDSGFVDDALYPDLLCPVTLTRSIKIDEFASLFYEVVPSSSFEARNGIFCARLQVKSLGWIGFALSRDGSMVGSEAIIALPDDGTVLKYSLLGKSPDLISKVDDEHQTLRGTSVTQDLALGVTTMAFVKHLDEFEEIPILEKGANHFLYARGGINVLGYHLGRMHFMKDFAEDVVVAVDDDVSVDLGDVNATILSNSTGSEDIYVIDTVVVGNETFVTYDDTPIHDLNKPEPFYNTTVAGNETIMTTNSTSEDFVIDTVVIGNETFVSFGDMPTIDANGTDSGFDMDVLYPDVNSTEDDSNETATPNDVVTISNETLYSVDDASGTAVNATDFADPAAILDALSLPYTLSHEIEGVSAAARYGFSVAMSGDGNIIAVGAKDMTDVVLGEVGALHLYSMETSPPSLLQTLVNEYPNGEFGNSIGLSNDGSRLVVGARSENDQTGVVRVYGRDSVGQFALLGMPINGLSSGERAGWSVSISGDGSSVAVGAPKGGGRSSGSVVTYRFEDGLNWAPYGSALEGVSKEAFGYTTSLSYDGNLVAVGSPKAMNPDAASNAGKASVFYMFGTEWLPLPAKEIHGISSNDIDGTSIALSQDGAIMVVGGKGRDNDDGVKNVGHCRIYEFGTDWDLLHSMEGQSQNERLGSSVAVSKNGNVVACGGEAAMYDGVGIGVVRVWNRKTSQSSAVWPRTSDGGALFGSALSLKEDGKILAVGAPERNSMTVGSKAGAVDVYRDFI
mmetsp:Transcript_11211/g.22340  ORF Transcript_11211/g.22340 Transcript_11211/m.22340 type:complete len:2173 (+) Transcript_11211:96-6614(+)